MLSKRARSITPSLTLGTSAKVKQMKSEGIRVINLSIGEPDFNSSEAVKEAGIQAIKDNKTKYDAAAGNMELRRVISKDYEKRRGLRYAPEDIVVSSGAKHAITNALIALVDPGDEVLIPSPYWVSYPEMVALTGANAVFLRTKKENGFLLTLEDVKAHVSEKTKVMILTNPSNPTGNVYTKEELTEICSYLVERDIYIIADEIYEQIVFEGTFTPIASLSQAIREKTIIINGVSKCASMTGWRIGYSLSSPEIAKAMSSIQSHLVGHPATISQAAAIEAVENGAAYLEEMMKHYKQRREYIINFFKEWNTLNIIPPKGAFYIFIDISPLRKKIQDNYLSVRVADDMITKKKVAFVAGAGFGEDDFLRMSYAASLEDIKEGLEKLKEYVEELLV